MKGSEYFSTVAADGGLSKVHPSVAAFLKRYLENEKAIRFDGKLVLNTHFPPWPSRAFENLAEQMASPATERRLYNVTVAVTNRCPLKCWHCYNAGRSNADMPIEGFRRLATDLQDRGAVMIQLTGGEPLMRNDLEDLFRCFDDRSCILLGTTGMGLTEDRAAALRDAGVFGVGISLDSNDEREHDRLRGRPGAFRAALDALRRLRAAGLYAYVVKVATRESLAPDRFWRFMEFARDTGALEVHVLEPCAAGRLAGKSDVLLRPDELDRILRYQRDAAAREDLPIVSTFNYLEGADAFGCGAGITHLYVDGSGEVSPCNLVPISFGNAMREPLATILERMGQYFVKPRCHCVGRTLTPHTWNLAVPTPPDVSRELCERYLPKEHDVPEFFRVRAAAQRAGATELKSAYDKVHTDYDDFWVCAAGAPVADMVKRLELRGAEQIFEAGCGTGFGTELLAGGLKGTGHVLAVDLSEGMLHVAQRRLASAADRVTFLCGDALAALRDQRSLDVVFTSWVLGYIEVKPFLAATVGALKPDGRLALVVHTQNSPRREWSLFESLVAENPEVLTADVTFDFPRDLKHLKRQLTEAGLTPEPAWGGTVVFHYNSAGEVLDHLLKSGAGTVFYEAVVPARRDALTAEFLRRLTAVNGPPPFEVKHDYVACLVRKPGPAT